MHLQKLAISMLIKSTQRWKCLILHLIMLEWSAHKWKWELKFCLFLSCNFVDTSGKLIDKLSLNALLFPHGSAKAKFANFLKSQKCICFYFNGHSKKCNQIGKMKTKLKYFATTCFLQFTTIEKWLWKPSSGLFSLEL